MMMNAENIRKIMTEESEVANWLKKEAEPKIVQAAKIGLRETTIDTDDCKPLRGYCRPYAAETIKNLLEPFGYRVETLSNDKVISIRW